MMPRFKCFTPQNKSYPLTKDTESREKKDNIFFGVTFFWGHSFWIGEVGQMSSHIFRILISRRGL